MKKPFPGLFLLDYCIYRLWRIVRKLREALASSINRRIMLRLGACGKGVRLHGRIIIHCPKNVEIGDNVHIGDNAWIQGDGGLRIGDNCHISRNLTLYTINHRYEGTRLPYDNEFDIKPVVIGRNVWIGMNVCVAPGTTIGDGAIIGMGTVVSGEIPPMCIIGNQKWRVIGYRDKDKYETLDRNQLYR